MKLFKRLLSGVFRTGAWAVLLLSFGMPQTRAQGEDLDVLKRWVEWSDAQNLFQRHLNSLAFDFLDNRRAKLGALRSADDWRRRNGAREYGRFRSAHDSSSDRTAGQRSATGHKYGRSAHPHDSPDGSSRTDDRRGAA